ncbi:MAG: hypothetical protein CVU17_08680 [Betaproteobacteria bacterium HGW-Betaproteobacteria-11]|nr:MAG: hypothetical protein CVU17_08680 [Betaproteobacteria bacterium HGW-Betaproteobacteria-11]
MMNSRVFELALKKQRLQLSSTQLRDEFSRHGAAFAPFFAGADHVVDGVRWLRAHPQIPLALGAGFLLARPRRLLRWSRRALIGWQVWRRLRGVLKDRPVLRRGVAGT